ncbi:MAG: aminotransferase class V-fold PLP-dependent enzyme [Sphaerochaeta sp.]|jgi:cysteine desulfurase|nr:aminotransferase class V-fold PLP-dependent enzyme [Spirochaetota bacterium]NLL23958.1 aminotransferase class V-fold PLP-dependent enzyme [Spirochaetales bacterium]TAH57723.1 MAG: aminotransferase class V-fold PLP-dependent enzyme [Sphaerochaeta sp.]
MRFVYLDNNATTPLHEDVIASMNEALALYGNASSMHAFGRDAAFKIEEARSAVADVIGAPSGSIVFTSGASEANNTVFNIFRERIDLGSKRNRIITTEIEHPSIIETVAYLRGRGYRIDLCPVDNTGRVRLDVLERLLAEDVALVSVMFGNNEIGTIQPIKEIVEMAHKVGAYVHSDATQAIGKIEVSMKELGLDYLSLSAHKFYGPKGVGALAVAKGAPFTPYIHGGHQESGRRAGTYNTVAIIGMGVAAGIAKRDRKDEEQRLWKMREMLRKGIIERIPNVVINGNQEHCLPGTLDVSFPHAEGESILLYLDLEGIQVSTGSACASGSLEPSYVLLSSGVDIELAHGSIRFSFGRYNTEDDVAYVLEKLPPIIKRLREMSAL